jgi:hypothetical protein
MSLTGCQHDGLRAQKLPKEALLDAPAALRAVTGMALLGKNVSWVIVACAIGES